MIVAAGSTITYGGGNNESGTVTFAGGGTASFSGIEVINFAGAVDGTAGADTIGVGYVDGQNDTVDGADGNDDTIYGYGGNDSIVAGAGNGDYTLFDQDAKPVRTEKGELGEADHIPNFLKAIRDNAPQQLHCGIDDAHKSTLLTHLGNIAHRTGRALTCDATNGHILNDADAMNYWKREYEPGWEPKIS